MSKYNKEVEKHNEEVDTHNEKVDECNKSDIALRKEKINWNKIINLALKRQDWGKIYTLFVYGTTTVTCVMKEFNFEESTAWFKLKVKHTTNLVTKEEISLVRYALNNFTLEDFNMHLNKKIISTLNEAKSSFVKKMAEEKFYELRFWSFRMDERKIFAAGLKKEYEFIDGLNDNLKEDLMDVLENKATDILNEPFKKKVREYITRDTTHFVGFEEIEQTLKVGE